MLDAKRAIKAINRPTGDASIIFFFFLPPDKRRFPVARIFFLPPFQRFLNDPMIFRNNFYEDNKRRRGDDIEHELRFKLLLTYVCNRYFFLSIPLIKLFQLWKMQEGRRISGTKFIRNSCAKGNFFTRVCVSSRFLFSSFFRGEKIEV